MSPTTTAVRQPARRGRPCGRGVKRWHGEAVARVVRDALAARDVDDPESVTETTYRLCEAVAGGTQHVVISPKDLFAEIREGVGTATLPQEMPMAFVKVMRQPSRRHDPNYRGTCGT